MTELLGTRTLPSFVTLKLMAFYETNLQLPQIKKSHLPSCLLFQDIQWAVGRYPVRVEPSVNWGTACWASSPRKGQGGVLPACGHALCALHPDLQAAGGGVWPGGAPSEETSHSGDSWWCDGEGVRAEEWNGGKGVLRVPLHGWCRSRLEAYPCEFHFYNEIGLLVLPEQNYIDLFTAGTGFIRDDPSIMTQLNFLCCHLRQTLRSPSLASSSVIAVKKSKNERRCWQISWKWWRLLKAQKWVEK